MPLPLLAIPVLASAAAGSLASAVGKLLIEGTKYALMRLFAIFIITVTLPLVLYKVYGTLLQKMMSAGLQYISQGNYESVVVSLSGMGGYLAYYLKIPDVIAMYIAVISTKFLLKLMRII